MKHEYPNEIGSLIMLHWKPETTSTSAMNLLLTAGDVYTRRVANGENCTAVFADLFVATRENTKIAKALGLKLKVERGEYVAKSAPMVRDKNEMGKCRKVNNPYETYVAGDWTWRVLKKYQAPSKEKLNRYARWFCAVKTPMTMGSYDMGDTYVSDILGVARATKVVETNPETW